MGFDGGDFGFGMDVVGVDTGLGSGHGDGIDAKGVKGHGQDGDRQTGAPIGGPMKSGSWIIVEVGGALVGYAATK